MNTIVEFFDQSPIKNLIATISLCPKNLVVVADPNTVTRRQQSHLINYLREYHKNITVEFFSFDSNKRNSIVSVCSQILASYPDAGFNITGGGELAISAVSIFCKENNAEAFYINFADGYMVDILTGKESAFPIPALSAPKIIALSGAMFKRCDHYVPDLNNVLLTQMITNVFDIFMLYNDSWYSFVAYMQEADKYKVGDPYQDHVRISAPAFIVINAQRKVKAEAQVLKALENKGVISGLNINRDTVSFSMNSKVILEQFKLQGSWLEQFCYISASEMNYFDNVMMSVIIDVDGPINDFAAIQNEIDLICVKGIESLFCSCKSGIPTTMSLNEIKQMSAKFGGETAKAVIITAADLSVDNPVVYKRIMELGIYVIEKRNMMSKENFQKTLKSIVDGSFEYAYATNISMQV